MSGGFGSAARAVMIGIDGITPRSLGEAIRSGRAPHLAALRAGGTLGDDVRGTQPPVSLSSWASLLTGAPPSFHGVHMEAQYRPKHPLRERFPVRPATYPDVTHVYPTLFTALREARPTAATAAYYTWPPLAGLLDGSLNVSSLRPCNSCKSCQAVEEKLAAEYAELLVAHRFDLSWVYFDTLDECAHAHGDRNATVFGPLVERVDSWVGAVVSSLRNARMLSSTLVLVLSDHGRRAPDGKHHSRFTTEEMVVPWILHGPGVRRGHTLTWPVSNTDAAPTLLHALGVTPPVQMHGRVVAEAFREGAYGASGGLSVPRGGRAGAEHQSEGALVSASHWRVRGSARRGA